MTPEKKQLLFQDLCARLPYRVMVHENLTYSDGYKIVNNTQDTVLDTTVLDWLMAGAEEVKPYLRPMNTMTEEENRIFINTQTFECGECSHPKYEYTYKTYDYLNSIHIDYRGLIPMGLALPAPEGMYKK